MAFLHGAVWGYSNQKISTTSQKFMFVPIKNTVQSWKSLGKIALTFKIEVYFLIKPNLGLINSSFFSSTSYQDSAGYAN